MNFKNYFFESDQEQALKERECLEELVVRLSHSINSGEMEQAELLIKDIGNSFSEIRRMYLARKKFEELLQEYGRLTIARAISDYNE